MTERECHWLAGEMRIHLNRLDAYEPSTSEVEDSTKLSSDDCWNTRLLSSVSVVDQDEIYGGNDRFRADLLHCSS